MNIKQEGLGVCPTHGTAIMQAINQPGVKGVCFACVEDAKPKAGRTVVVKSETGETKAMTSAPEGKVEIEVVGAAPVDGVTTSPGKAGAALRTNSIAIYMSVDELEQADMIRTLLQKVNEGIDEMPPPSTIKEAKRIFKLQERIEEVIKSMESK